MIKKIYEGKSRDVYEISDDKLVIVASDRISMHKPLPYLINKKGQVLNKMAEYWFTKYKDIIPNHMITTDNSEMPEFFQKDNYKNRCMMVKKVHMFRFECVVRGYVTGSCWELYKKGEDICGIKLKEGLVESQKLDNPIFTPTTKDDNGKDTNVTYEEFEKNVGKEKAREIKDKSIELYMQAHDYLLSKGIILADTKMEFGLDSDNNLILADELLTPDCSRFWLLENYRLGSEQTNFDREELKKYIAEHGLDENTINNIPENILNKIKKKYIDIYKIVVGKEL